ncbi:MAG: hypothetical protein Q9166_007644 [cf. Caloplaca sp. 2 TL-2023]
MSQEVLPSDGPTMMIFRANDHLSSGRPREAIDLYTEVLYLGAPGHIVAFLNRSLAYIVGNRPDLAVTDAYRAGLSINTMYEKHSKARQRLAETKRYLLAEEARVNAKHDWTRRHRRNIFPQLKSWTGSPLASLVMHHEDAPILFTKDDSIDPGFHDFERLEARAVFRLCGALFECRGGAISEALGLISDALRDIPRFNVTERDALRRLGDSMTASFTSDADAMQKRGRPTEDGYKMLVPVDGMMIPQTTLSGIIKSRVALIPTPMYWEDRYEPDLTKPDTYQELRNFVADVSETVSPVVTGQSSVALTPRIELRALKDHLPGEVLLYDRSPWHVTTDSPATTLEKRRKNRAGCVRLYCDTCATALLAPEAMVINMMLSPSDRQAALQRNTQATASTAKDRSVKASQELTMAGIIANDSAEDDKRESKLPWCRAMHVSFCSDKHQAAYCSTTCRLSRRAFDPGLHDEVIEHELRTIKSRMQTSPQPLPHVDITHPRNLYSHPKTQTIFDLLLLRIYASALNDNKHPLELTKFIRCLLSPASTPTIPTRGHRRPTEAPWTFHNNVVVPINSIHRFHRASKEDPFDHLQQSDGWVLNTLIDKIRSATELSRGAMSAIVYDMDNETKRWCHRGVEEWVSDVGDAVYDSEQDFNEVWVGQLNPVISMIRRANEAQGERPNCWLRYDQGVKVIAGQPDDPPDKATPAIRACETLLRPQRVFLGGGPNDVKSWTQRRDDAPYPGSDDETSTQAEDNNRKDDSDQSMKDVSEHEDDTGADSNNSPDSDDDILDLDYTDPESSNSPSPDRSRSPPHDKPPSRQFTPVNTHHLDFPAMRFQVPNTRLRNVKHKGSRTPTNGTRGDDSNRKWQDEAHPNGRETGIPPRSRSFRNGVEAKRVLETYQRELKASNKGDKKRKRKAKGKEVVRGVGIGKGMSGKTFPPWRREDIGGKGRGRDEIGKGKEEEER